MNALNSVGEMYVHETSHVIFGRGTIAPAKVVKSAVQTATAAKIWM